jgi:hypothetical protein
LSHDYVNILFYGMQLSIITYTYIIIFFRISQYILELSSVGDFVVDLD